MANMHLVTGYAGQEHVTAADQAAFHNLFIGGGEFVLDTGNQFAASIISNNQVRVLDGDIYMQGRFIRLDKDTSVDLLIENGAQGYSRHDLIVARYTQNQATAIEEVNLVVIKGEPVTSNPVDPAYTIGDILVAGDMLHDFPLYRVVIEGLNLVELVPLFPTYNSNLQKKQERTELLAEDTSITDEDYFSFFDAVTKLPKKILWKILRKHEHTADDITDGVLPVERGGTGANNPTDLVSALGVMRGDMHKKIASYETAGAYEWVAPDLCDGRPYKIGVLIIGGGGSGSATLYAGGSDYSSSVSDYALGGGSGYSKHFIMIVAPGDTKLLVVGAGGVFKKSYSGNGSPGGTTSFDGTVVSGGGAGTRETSNSNAIRSLGSRGNGCGIRGEFGLETYKAYNSYARDEAPWQCVNLFEMKEILGSGGCAMVVEDTGEIRAYRGGKGVDGLGGGNAGATGGEDGTAPGCGGGGTIDGYTAGKGADGAVYIYFLGVAEE